MPTIISVIIMIGRFLISFWLLSSSPLKASEIEIVFDLDDQMGDSTCVGCGECVQACPTGALMPSNDAGLNIPDKKHIQRLIVGGRFQAAENLNKWNENHP